MIKGPFSATITTKPQVNTHIVAVAQIQDLTVRYGRFTALDHFSVELPEGCVGLLGPNGAGKTTFLKTLLGFISPAGGGGTVLGNDISGNGLNIRQVVGYMPEQDCHIPGMTAVQFVAYAAELVGMPRNHAISRAHESLEYVGLGEARYRTIETYSTGMKQRVKLAQALVHDPKLLLLDEPTNGLDPAGREEMLLLIKDIAQRHSRNSLVCSHLLPDIERTCEHVIVLVNGKLQMAGNITEIKAQHKNELRISLREPSGAFLQAISGRGISVLEAKSNEYLLSYSGDTRQAMNDIFQSAKETQNQVRSLSQAERSLEDVFMEVIRGDANPIR